MNQITSSQFQSQPQAQASSSSSGGWFGKVKGLFSKQHAPELDPAKKYDFANPDAYAPPKFDSSDPHLATFFKEHGYVVIKQVADKEQRRTAIGLFWDLCEGQVDHIKRDDPATWDDTYWVANNPVGIVSGYGIGQSPFLWYTRTLPKVKESFSRIWNTDDLLVSYDGCGVFRPPEQNPSWKTINAWYHIDQNCYNRQGLHAIQGLVNYYPSGPHDGGFVVVPRSHIMITEAFATTPGLCSKNASDYFQTPEDLKFWVDARQAIGERNAENRYDLLPVKLILEPGDLVLWDSRTIHCNHPATKDDKKARNRLKRLVAYVCMTPAASAKDLETLVKYRVLAFQKGITTGHWPHEFYPGLIPREKPQGVGADTIKLTADQATLITGKTLASWNVYDEKLVEGVNLDDLDN